MNTKAGDTTLNKFSMLYWVIELINYFGGKKWYIRPARLINSYCVTFIYKFEAWVVIRGDLLGGSVTRAYVGYVNYIERPSDDSLLDQDIV